MKKIVFLVVTIVILTACTPINEENREPLIGEKEVIEMIKDRIHFNETADYTVQLYKREGSTDKKVTVKGTGHLLKEQYFESEVSYDILQLESAKEAKDFLANEIKAYEQVDGLDYSIEFFEPYFYEEITITYDDLNIEQYEALQGNVVSRAEKERDFLYLIREYVEKGYQFID